MSSIWALFAVVFLAIYTSEMLVKLVAYGLEERVDVRLVWMRPHGFQCGLRRAEEAFTLRGLHQLVLALQLEGSGG